MNITIIAAIAHDNAIGYHNKLLYWLPDDLKRFKRLTTGHTIIMGRKTFESFPKGALPHRRNVVLTHQGELEFPGAESFPSLQAALASCKEEEEVYIIGGASVYEEALPVADHLCLTQVDNTPPHADAYFPVFNKEEWNEIHAERHQADERHAFNFTFMDYYRK